MEGTIHRRSKAGLQWYLGISGLAGLCLACWIVARAWPFSLGPSPLPAFLGAFFAATSGYLMRGVRRRMVLGSRVSLGRSLSLEVIVQVLQVLSPLIPRKAFEAGLLQRETTLGSSAVYDWLEARSLNSGAVVLAGLSWVTFLLGYSRSAALLCAISLVILGIGIVKGAAPLALVRAFVLGLAAWAVEGAIFVWAASPVLPPSHGWALYLAFTGLWDYSPIPLSLGWALLPAFLSQGRFPDAVAFLLLLQGMRLALLALLGWVCLPRHKFVPADLMDPGILGALRPRRCQSAGEGKTPGLSLVIPAFNEEERLPAFLESVRAYAGSSSRALEVLVVDDGSRDGTADVVKRLSQIDPRFRLICQERNQGKGAAVRRGMLEARGGLVCFADADGATPVTELERLIPVIESGVDVAIGSRAVEDPFVARHRVGGRRLMGRLFYFMVSALAVPGIRDTQCGFKLFRRESAQLLFAKARESGWAFDVEVLYLAQLVGCRIQEVAVNWKEIPGSKVHPIRDALRMAVAVFRIRNRHAGFLRHAEDAERDPAPSTRTDTKSI